MDKNDFISIALVGNFNPPIFHPEWFDRHQLLPPNEVRDVSKITEFKPAFDEAFNQKIKFISSNVFISPGMARLSLPSYKIEVSPEKFDARTSIKEKIDELVKFVCATFKILEHTPIQALGINFLSSLKFSQSPAILMHDLFCHKAGMLDDLFNKNYLIDSRIRYDYKDSKVTLTIENKDTEIGFNFNYNKNFTEKDRTNEVIEYLMNNFYEMMSNTDEVIRTLFGDPVEGEKNE